MRYVQTFSATLILLFSISSFANPALLARINNCEKSRDQRCIFTILKEMASASTTAAPSSCACVVKIKSEEGFDRCYLELVRPKPTGGLETLNSQKVATYAVDYNECRDLDKLLEAQGSAFTHCENVKNSDPRCTRPAGQ